MQSRSLHSKASPRPLRRLLRLVILLLFLPISAISSMIMVSSLPRFSRRPVCATRLQLIGTTAMQCVPCTRPLCPSCLNHFILIVRLLLTTMLLSLSLILTLTLVRLAVCLLLYFLWEVYRDCFHVFLSLCVFFLFSSGFARGGLVTHNLSSLPGLAFSVIS